jgi:hypothetical protein
MNLGQRDDHLHARRQALRCPGSNVPVLAGLGPFTSTGSTPSAMDSQFVLVTTATLLFCE